MVEKLLRGQREMVVMQIKDFHSMPAANVNNKEIKSVTENQFPQNLQWMVWKEENQYNG